MRKNAALSALLFLLLLMLANWPASASTVYDGMETKYTVQDLAPDKPSGPNLVDDPIPRVMVRFDDGRLSQYTNNQIQAFLRRGIPVTVSLNSETTSDGNSMTWPMVRDLQAFARSKGTVLHIMQHGNGNFPTPNLLTHDEIVAQLETSRIFQETGYRVRAWLSNGDGGLTDAWLRRNRDYAQTVCDSLGIWYIFNETHADSSSVMDFTPNLIQINLFASSESSYRDTFIKGQRPGMNIPRNDIPRIGASDLGQLVVERVASWPSQYDSASHYTPLSHYLYGSWNITGVIPPHRVNEWTLTGNGASPATTANTYGGRTWAGEYSRLLSGNYGFVVAIHDSAATAGLADPIFTDISLAEYAAGGAFSPEHIAWTLAMLEKKGHIKLVGAEEWAEWVTGEWAEDTELIANPSCLIPQFDIGDTLGATTEYALIRGFGTVGRGTTAPDSTLWGITPMTPNNAGGTAKWAHVGPRAPHSRIGLDVVGVRGRQGGISVASSGGFTRLRPAIGSLPPGRYEWSMAVKSAGTISMRGIRTAAMVKGYKLTAGAAVGYATAYNDSVFTYMYKDDTQTMAMTGHTNRWTDFVVPLHFPQTWLGETSGSPVFGQTEEATGATLAHPYGAGASEFLPLIGSQLWAFSLDIEPAANSVWTNPRLVYRGK